MVYIFCLKLPLGGVGSFGTIFGACLQGPPLPSFSCPISMVYRLLMAGRDPEKQRAAKRRYYERNKEAVKDKARNHSKRMRKAVKEWLHEYLKSNPCVDCGETEPIILEFDHVDPRLKEFNIGEANSLGITLTRVIDEVAKCDVRCANCHRKKTYRDAGLTHRG